MKQYLPGILIILPLFASSQDSTKNDIALGISSYFFQYQEHQDGSTAIGPTLLFTDNDVSLQLGVLLDLQKYQETDYGNTQGTPSVSTARSILLPVFGQYRFYQKEKITLFATLGVIIGVGALLWWLVSWLVRCFF